MVGMTSTSFSQISSAAHVAGAAGSLESLLDDVHAVIGVGRELVGLAAVSGRVSINESSGCDSTGSGERGHEHEALGKCSIEAGHGEDAVHTVHTEEGGSIAHGVGLTEDHGGGLIVDGKEHDVGAGGLRRGELDGEVGSGIIGEGALIDNAQALVGCLSLERVTDALRIRIIVTIDDSDLRVSVCYRTM